MKALYIAFIKREYERILILEIGADKKGDIEEITKWIKPDIACITHIPSIPVHIEAFNDVKELVYEKGYLISNVKDNGSVIIGDDNPHIDELLNRVKNGVNIIKVGSDKKSDIKMSDVVSDINYQSSYVKGNIVKGEGKNSITIKGVVGKQHIIPVLYAIAVSNILNIDIKESIKKIENRYHSPNGRMKVLNGFKTSIIIDDTYNSSPSALKVAIDTLKEVKDSGRRGVLILGDMKELGKHSSKAHIDGILMAKDVAEKVILVGDEMKRALEEINDDKINHYNTSKECAMHIRDIIDDEDVILVKGSQSARMEIVVKNILRNKEDEKFLVRQEKEWLYR